MTQSAVARVNVKDNVVGRVMHEVWCPHARKLRECLVFLWDDWKVVDLLCVRVLLEVDWLMLVIPDGSDLAKA